ncbi:hypothetical protein SAMN04487845_12591 [Methylobacterium sp. yr668]|nr:hypothetical protein SAMN04487845_12591 [Methylobacterium sp. yr668]
MSDVNTASSTFLIGLDAEEKADLPRATYIMLEAYYEADDNYHLTSIEEAEEEGGFALHIGLPDRPAHRYATHFGSFEAGLKCLQRLKKESHPNAGMWLSTVEILAEIKGDDIWRGTVHARASCDPTDNECAWNTLSAALTKADAQGRGVVLITEEMPSVIKDIATHL